MGIAIGMLFVGSCRGRIRRVANLVRASSAQSSSSASSSAKPGIEHAIASGYDATGNVRSSAISGAHGSDDGCAPTQMDRNPLVAGVAPAAIVIEVLLPLPVEDLGAVEPMTSPAVAAQRH